MVSSNQLIDAAILTLFAREALEGSIIIAEYRTVVQYGDNLDKGVTKNRALRAITVSSLCASILAILVIFAVAVPLSILSKDFDPTTSQIIEGVSKVVAGVCMLQLSLKLPKWLGLYRRSATTSDPDNKSRQMEQGMVSGDDQSRGSPSIEGDEDDDSSEAVDAERSSEESAATADVLTLSSIRFNVAWNIWREVAECGVFLIPSFLTGEGLVAIPLSGLIGIIIGGGLGCAVYYANQRLQSKKWSFSIFVILLVSFLSAGLVTDGAHNLEKHSPTKQVWAIPMPSFWDAYKMPMTFLKPFGYSSSRTILQVVVFWSWLALIAVLQYWKYRRCTATAAFFPSTEEKLSRGDTVKLGGSSGSDSSGPKDKMSDSRSNSSSSSVEVLEEP